MITFLFSVAAHAAEFHSLVVADTYADEVMSNTLYDYHLVRDGLNEITVATGMRHVARTLTGHTVTPEHVQGWVDYLQVGEDDVIFFYYSGHGVQSDDVWPNMRLSKGDLHYGSLLEQLKSKGARLVIAIADCCNCPPNVSNSPLLRPSAKLKPNYHELFLEASGSVSIVAAERGTAAHGYLVGPSEYTQAFFRTLQHSVRKSDELTWEQILDWTEQSITQKPFSIID